MHLPDNIGVAMTYNSDLVIEEVGKQVVQY